MNSQQYSTPCSGKTRPFTQEIARGTAVKAFKLRLTHPPPSNKARPLFGP